MRPIINVSALSKQYRLGTAQPAYVTLRDALFNRWRAASSRTHRQESDGAETIWALKDINFSVQPGEVVGIIGRNGAGKSTLLKILSRITDPTVGEVNLYGRVASLLEVGTGFHYELTGRENIFLNGTILGMRRAEIARKFDEIVEFAEIGRFIDTPVKHYSTGMYMRLAFSVAAHLEPEILIVDEVLAVGDAAFQRKCLGKMGAVARDGRTILFVSHNMGAIQQLCTRALLLKGGECSLDASPHDAAVSYMEEAGGDRSAIRFPLDPSKSAQITAIDINSIEGNPIAAIAYTCPFQVEIEYRVNRWPVGSVVALEILDQLNNRIIWTSDVASVEDVARERLPGEYRAVAEIPGGILTPGRYYLTVKIFTPGRWTITDVQDAAVSIDLTDSGSFLSHFGAGHPAMTAIELQWRRIRRS